MPTCETPPTLHLGCKDTKKIRYSIKSSGFFFILRYFLCLHAFYGHTLVCFYVLNDSIVVVVSVASYEVKL